MAEKQLLHLVFGGVVTDPQSLTFEDRSTLTVVGIFPNYEDAEKAWRRVSQASVDEAMARFVIVPLHELLYPDEAVGK